MAPFNGKVERVIRELRDYLKFQPPAATLTELAAQIAAWVHEHNLLALPRGPGLADPGRGLPGEKRTNATGVRGKGAGMPGTRPAYTQVPGPLQPAGASGTGPAGSSLNLPETLITIALSDAHQASLAAKGGDYGPEKRKEMEGEGEGGRKENEGEK
ncbi:MAG: hypothetical protein C4575_07400 [Desulforudis sp.]|nr:MAG: hypothetical protein C4575_07400 [Desulforudis sp.]